MNSGVKNILIQVQSSLSNEIILNDQDTRY